MGNVYLVPFIAPGRFALGTDLVWNTVQMMGLLTQQPQSSTEWKSSRLLFVECYGGRWHHREWKLLSSSSTSIHRSIDPADDRACFRIHRFCTFFLSQLWASTCQHHFHGFSCTNSVNIWQVDSVLLFYWQGKFCTAFWIFVWVIYLTCEKHCTGFLLKIEIQF